MMNINNNDISYYADKAGLIPALVLIPIGVISFAFMGFDRNLASALAIWLSIILPMFGALLTRIVGVILKIPNEYFKLDSDLLSSVIVVVGFSLFFLPAFILLVPSVLWIYFVSMFLTVSGYK